MESKKPDLELDPDPEAPPSEEELAASARLRDALEDPSQALPEAELARAVALAYEPREIGDAENRAIVARALATASPRRPRSRGVVVRVAFGVATAVALAASVILIVRSGERPSATAALAVTRSTQPLFADPFAPPESRRERRAGEESSRIDRIAMARSVDLRANRFTKWGVR